MKLYPKLIDPEILAEDHRALKVQPSGNKAFLYSIAFGLSLAFISFVLVIGQLQPSTLKEISKFISSIPFFDFKLSEDLTSQLRFPGPITNTLFAGNFCFLALMLFDIFRKDKIAQDGSKDLFKEASSVSYSIHIVVLLWILLAVMFNYEPKPKIQVTQIQYIRTQTPSQKKPPDTTKRKAAKQSIDAGKHDPKRKITPAADPAGKPSLPPKQAQTKPQPEPKPQAKPKAEAPPSPALTPKPIPEPSPPISKPSPTPKLTPQPKVAKEGINPFKSSQEQSLPKLMNYNPGSTIGATGSGGTPSPAPKAGSGTTTGTGDRNSNIVSRLSNIPRAPDSLGGSGAGGSYGAPGNAGPNSNPNVAPSLAAKADVNFGPYMSSLQRKIKMAWKPPRGTESTRILVTFSVNADGSINNLKILTKSSYPEANQAAIDAINNAAPFDRLPPGSTPPLDIEFTFDYSVFQTIRY